MAEVVVLLIGSDIESFLSQVTSEPENFESVNLVYCAPLAFGVSRIHEYIKNAEPSLQSDLRDQITKDPTGQTSLTNILSRYLTPKSITNVYGDSIQVEPAICAVDLKSLENSEFEISKVSIFSSDLLYTTNELDHLEGLFLKEISYEEAEAISKESAVKFIINMCKNRSISLEVNQWVNQKSFLQTVIREPSKRVPGIKSIKGVWGSVWIGIEGINQLEIHDILKQTSSVSPLIQSTTLSSVSFVTNDEESILSAIPKNLQPKVIRGCGVVTLIGHKSSTFIYQLSEAFKLISESQINFSQGYHDHIFHIVMEERFMNDFISKVHSSLFSDPNVQIFGPKLGDLNKSNEELPVNQFPKNTWWYARRDDILDLAKTETPLYIYNQPTIINAINQLKSMTSLDKVFFAMKANPFPDILKLYYEAGLGFECVSPGEINHILKLFPDISRDRILFTPNFAPKEEYEYGLGLGVLVTVDNLYPLVHWPEVFASKKISIRIDPGKGKGHHKHVETGGKTSKFGISIPDLNTVSQIAKDTNVKIVGLHAHIGSGILTPKSWYETASALGSLLSLFPDVSFMDIGGGLGVVEKDDDTRYLDLNEVNQYLLNYKVDHLSKVGRPIQLWMEPGRYLVATSGVLVAKVTQTKNKQGSMYVGINTGFNSLLRPTLYSAYHYICNLTRLGEPDAITADVVGTICESGDVLGHNRRLPETKENDIILIATTGAYGRAMSSNYNLREPAREVMLV